MAKRALTIYIGSDIIRICDVTRKSNTQVVLHNATQLKTPENCVEDGMIIDPMQLALVLNRSIYGTKMKAKKVIFTIASKKIATKEIVFPEMKRGKIREAIENNAQDYFPMNNIFDYTFAHSVLEKMEEDDSKKLRISAIAAPKKLILSYYELAKFIKLPISEIDFFGNSVLQVLCFQMSGGCQLVVQIEKETTIVNVMSDKTLLLQRSIPFGKDAIVAFLAENKRLSHLEIEILMRKKDISETTISSEEYATAAKFIINGIQRTVEYYRSSAGRIEIEGIKLFGEGSTFPIIKRLIETQLGAKVSSFEQLKGVTVCENAGLTKAEHLQYLANLGSIIMPVGFKVDLEEKTRSLKRDSLFVYKIALFLSIVIAISMGIGVIALHDFQRKENQGIENRIQQLSSLEKIYTDYMQAQTEYDQILAHDASTANANEYVYEFILELETRLPENTQIESLVASGGEISISATTTEKDEVAEFVTQMKKSNMVSDIFISSTSDTDGDDRVTVFSASCSIHEPVEIEEEGETQEDQENYEGGEDEATATE